MNISEYDPSRAIYLLPSGMTILDYETAILQVKIGHISAISYGSIYNLHPNLKKKLIYVSSINTLNYTVISIYLQQIRVLVGGEFFENANLFMSYIPLLRI